MSGKNIHQRLAEAMRVVTYVQKEQKKGMQYTITSHDAVTAKVRPALLDAGIVYYPVRCEHAHNGNRAECGMTVRFVNIDEPTDFFEVPTFGYGVDPQDKGPGKAMSYAVKYALLKALGLETGDDADHDSIPHSPEDPAAPKSENASETKRESKAKPPASSKKSDAQVLSEKMIGAMRGAKDAATFAAINDDDKFCEDYEWLEVNAPDLAKDVLSAINDARARTKAGDAP